MNEVCERFLKAILERLPVERIAEIHFFPSIRQGPIETGVAVIGAYPEPQQLVAVAAVESDGVAVLSDGDAVEADGVAVDSDAVPGLSDCARDLVSTVEPETETQTILDMPR